MTKNSSRKLPIAVQTGHKLTSVGDVQRQCTQVGVWQSLQSPSHPLVPEYVRTHILEKRKSMDMEKPSVSTAVAHNGEKPWVSKQCGKAYNFHRHLKTYNSTQWRWTLHMTGKCWSLFAVLFKVHTWNNSPWIGTLCVAQSTWHLLENMVYGCIYITQQIKQLNSCTAHTIVIWRAVWERRASGSISFAIFKYIIHCYQQWFPWVRPVNILKTDVFLYLFTNNSLLPCSPEWRKEWS